MFFRAALLGLCLSLTHQVFADPNAASNHPSDHPGQIQSDAQLLEAIQARHNSFYVEAGNLTVEKVLPDDNQGLPHQRWVARLSNGSSIQIVYNSDMGSRVPMKVGDHFSAGGQFIWTGGGGLLHWLHDDPEGHRPDGYIYFNGTIYGDTDHEDSKVPAESSAH